MSKNNHRKIFFGLGLLVTLTGTYNAVVINSYSRIDSEDYGFTKRLDESLGVVTPGRSIAASPEWKKLERKYVEKVTQPVLAEKVEAPKMPVQEEVPAVAAIQEELNLNLIEVVNTKQWPNGLQADQFSGSIMTADGIIDSFTAYLPHGEISVSYAELTGNVFEYDLNGEIYSGMMYQVDQHSYMITLTNGPLEGTRMRFTQGDPEMQQYENSVQLAEVHKIETGKFGEASPMVEYMNEAPAVENVQAQVFNLGTSVSL